MKELLGGYTGNLPNRAEVEAALSAAPASKGVDKVFPYAERASTGRAKCIQCSEAIEKGALRVAIEREIEVMGNPRKGAGYYHAACAKAGLGDGVLEKVKPNSELAEADFAELAAALGG